MYLKRLTLKEESEVYEEFLSIEPLSENEK